MAPAPKPVEKKKKGRGGLLLGFLAILIGSHVGAYFLYNSGTIKTGNQRQLEADLALKEIELDEKTTQLDSLKSELEVRMVELKKLGADTTKLSTQLAELTAELDRVNKSTAPLRSRIKYLEEIRQEYTVNLQLQDAELIKLRALSDALQKDNSRLKEEIVTREDKIAELEGVKNELSEKVDQASILQADRFQVTTYNRRGKPTTGTIFKSKYVETLEVKFTLLENKVAQIGNKPVVLQLKDPSGAAVYNTEVGGGSFTHKGKTLYYTVSKDVFYDRKPTDVSMGYRKGDADMAAGRWTAEVYCEGNMIGSTTFQIK